MITETMKKEYIAHKGHRCLYCGSDQIEYGGVDWDDPLGVEVSCLDCELSWTDIMAVVDVVEK